MNRKKKDRTIFIKSVLILIVIFLPIIFGLLAFLKVGFNIISTDIKKSLNQRVEFCSSKLTYDLENIKIQINQMLINSDFLMLNLYLKNNNEVEKINLYNKVAEKMQMIKAVNNELINKIGIYYKENNLLISTETESPNKTNNNQIYSIINTASQHLVTFTYVQETDSFYFFSYDTNIPTQDVNYLTMIGFVQITRDNLETYIKKICLLQSGEDILLLSNDNKWSLGNTNIINNENLQLIKSNNLINIKDYFIQLSSMDIINGKFLLYTSTKNVMQNLNRYLLLGYLLITIVIGGVMIYIILLRKTINQPIKHLIKAFNVIDVDNLNEKFENIEQKEFSELYNGYNKMLDRLRLSIRELYEQKIITQKAELMYLQSQINPHFLYNSLYTISRMAKSVNNKLVYDFSMKLSNYYRYLARSNDDEIFFETEYQHAINYLDIQSTRFSKRINIEINDINENAKKIMVLKFILQPIIENVFEHGLKNTLKDGIIRIYSNYDNNVLHIIVEDNGSGLTDEKLTILQERLNEQKKISEDTGIYNVNRRLRIKYGEKSGLIISTSKLGGLCVEIVIYYN